jgi:C4-dicarboxylate-specific signal transduction histidine kinase
MMPEFGSKQALRDCCRDEAAFEKLKQLLAEMLTAIGVEALRAPNEKPFARTPSPQPESIPDSRQVPSELEILVCERTAQLQLANEQLLREMATREQVEQALRESEVKYRELVQNANSIILR